MAQYRALQDIYTDPFYILAGTVFSDTPGDSVPQMAPQGWIPPNAVDCLDAGALAAFWAVGPCDPSGQAINVAPPAVYWQSYPAGGGTRPMILTTAAGAALGFKNWTDTRGARP